MATAAVVGVELEERWTAWAAWTIAAVNVFDCLFTLAFLQLGLCQEANPFMRSLYDCSPWAFAGAKVALVSGGVALLLRLSTLRLARLALSLGAAVYGLLAAYELTGLVGTFG